MSNTFTPSRREQANRKDLLVFGIFNDFQVLKGTRIRTSIADLRENQQWDGKDAGTASLVHSFQQLRKGGGREEERKEGKDVGGQTLICACRYYHFDLVGKKPPSHETQNKNYFLVHCASFFAINFVIVSIWSYYLQLSVTHLVFNKYVCNVHYTRVPAAGSQAHRAASATLSSLSAWLSLQLLPEMPLVLGL